VSCHKCFVNRCQPGCPCDCHDYGSNPPERPTLREKDIRRVGVSFLRSIDRHFLRELLGDLIYVIEAGRQQERPLAVLLSYEQFIRIQETLQKGIPTQ